MYCPCKQIPPSEKYHTILASWKTEPSGHSISIISQLQAKEDGQDNPHAVIKREKN